MKRNSSASGASLKKLINQSPYKKQLNQMLKKGSPEQVVLVTLQEYTQSNTLTDDDLDLLDDLLRKMQLTDDEYLEMVSTYDGKSLFSAFYPPDVDPADPVTKTLREGNILMTFCNVEDVYTYINKYYPAKAGSYGIRVIRFSSIVEQAEKLGTIAVIGWRVGDDTANGRRTCYYDGAKQRFHRGAIVTHKTPEQLARYEAFAKQVM